MILLKKISLTIFLCFCAANFYAQPTSDTTEVEDFIIEEDTIQYESTLDKDGNPMPVEAYPKEGFATFYKKLSENMQNELKKAKIKEPIDGKVFIRFTINEDGSISYFKVVKSINKKIDKLAIKALKNSGAWHPAYHASKPVKSFFTVPVKVKYPR